ncbi:MAG: ABC transporter ATP-binding protein/permease [Candidatus Izimaplasma sp.]|nr:ABC transporter ATP-binding protein/permease [Candidatus Izimaplasma bacterium]
MIKLNKLDKYYNKNKDNEIHVLDDITLNLPDKGLVVLLGPSGSGKTTLLNVLGGLDKTDSGSIEFQDEVIKKYSSKKWDVIRNKNVGYVFQNYNLLHNLSVYDNIALTLHMLGIYDEDEINNRIDYILERIGMSNFKRRRATQLSGGQQQRVAIARALAKNPQVIIADEPTGNLDSKNTHDIMTIIKGISLNKLVVLVTHEEDLANAYADRIIRIEDGKIIKDKTHKNKRNTSVKHDTDIYLKDLNKKTNLTGDYASLEVYSDEEKDDQINIRLISKNNTLYIDIDSQEYSKMQLLESDSEIRIYDKSYDVVSTEVNETPEFKLDSVITKKALDPHHSVMTIKDSLKLAFNRMKDSTVIQKIFYLGFALGSILIAISLAMLFGIFRYESRNFLNEPKQTVTILKEDNTYETLKSLEETDPIGYLRYIDSININAELPVVFQTNSYQNSINAKVLHNTFIDGKVVNGRIGESPNEVLISTALADRWLELRNFKFSGVTSYESLLEINLLTDLIGVNEQIEYTIDIVGIVESENPVIYADETLIFTIDSKIGVIELFEDDITLNYGTLPGNENKSIVLDGSHLVDPIENNELLVYQEIISPTGTFLTENENVPKFLMSLDTLKSLYFSLNYGDYYSTISYITNDITQSKEILNEYVTDDNNLPTSTYEEALNDYRDNRLQQSRAVIIFAAVTLGASAIAYFFTIRSSLMNRIYEISVYRALGISKLDIHKIFTVEVIFITTFTSIIGYLFTSFILYRIEILTEGVYDGLYVSWWTIIVGALIIYGINILSGIVPVTNLVKKTPAEILTKYDF